MRHKWIIVIVLLVSIAVHFAFFGYPDETVFDEVHFGKIVSGYYTGQYYFDIHPPLGKLMIAGFAKLFSFSPDPSAGEAGFSFANIGDKFPDNKYLALRFLPALAGTLLPVIIFLLILELKLSREAAFAGGLFIVFENALLTQSRFILLDPFLFVFGFASLLFYFKKKYWLMAIFGGLAISVKWTGLGFIGLPILIEGYYKIKDRKPFNLVKFTSFFLLSLAIYFSVFALHFSLLPNPGPGDAFMKPSFREQNLVTNIWNLNIEMYKSNQRLTATHPYSSQWYSWPFMYKPVFYWIKDSAQIYLYGNPVVWWGGTIAVAIGIKCLVLNIIKRRKPDKLLTILIGGYVLNLLPFIGVNRVMFLYHYLTALIFAILILVYLIDKTKNRRKIFTGLLIASIAAFICFAPFSYGLPFYHSYFFAFW